MPRRDERRVPSSPSATTLENPFVPTHERIAARAYELFLQRGGEDGQDLRDWFQAEHELADDRVVAMR